ncbi:MAG: type I-U CRISPR-associated protein Csb2 [Bryobacteraceae bacterium]
MLAIEVEYLLGRVYAAEFRDGSRPEWPPHPARLFSALVAAHHDSNGSGQERNALLWLENQGAPQILASARGLTNEVVNFVPTNYQTKSGNTHPDDRTKQPRSFPAQSPESPIVRFVWEESEPPSEHAAALASLLQRVTSLGRACSLVRAGLVQEPALDPDASSYVPDQTGPSVLAAPSPGRLDDLERTYFAGRRPQQGTPVRYRQTAEEPSRKDIEVRGHFGDMIIFRRLSGLGFPSTSTPLLTKQLRRAFLSHAGHGDKQNEILSGHAGDDGPAVNPHVAFAALPNVGGDHGDGRLMGLAVILPMSISRRDRRMALRASASIETLTLDNSAAWKIEIANFDVPQRTLRPGAWISASKHWATVTPILLDRYPKKQESAEELLVLACLRAGLPQPESITFGPYAAGGHALKGVAPVFAYNLNRYAVHATVDFRQKVKGPVLLGAGRFFGMGLLKPIFDQRQEE